MFRVRLSMLIDTIKVALFAPLRIANKFYIWLQGYRYTNEDDNALHTAVRKYVRLTLTSALERNLIHTNGIVPEECAHEFRLVWEEARGSVTSEDSEAIARANVWHGPDYVDDLVGQYFAKELEDLTE